MTRTLSEVMASLPAGRRARIEAETARMAGEIMTLQQVRKAFNLTQNTIAKALDMEQESISRIERRADLLLSTLRDYIGAMGGSLKLIAEFPDHPAIQIETLMDLSGEAPASGKTGRRKLQRSSEIV